MCCIAFDFSENPNLGKYVFYHMTCFLYLSFDFCTVIKKEIRGVVCREVDKESDREGQKGVDNLESLLKPFEFP